MSREAGHAQGVNEGTMQESSCILERFFAHCCLLAYRHLQTFCHFWDILHFVVIFNRGSFGSYGGPYIRGQQKKQNPQACDCQFIFGLVSVHLAVLIPRSHIIAPPLAARGLLRARAAACPHRRRVVSQHRVSS